MAMSCMRHASGHNYRNSSFIVDLAMGQIPHSTEHIFSCCVPVGFNVIYLAVELLAV